MSINGLDNEEFRLELEKAAKEFLDKRSKKEKVFTDEFLATWDSSSKPWDDIPEQDYKDFMEYVGYEWESEMHSEGYTRSYEKVRWDCWLVYSGNIKKES